MMTVVNNSLIDLRNAVTKKGIPENENPKLPDGMYSVSDIQDYFEYIIQKIQKHEAVADIFQ